MSRIFDLFFSIVGIIALSPIFILVSIWILIDTGRPIFYGQVRIGRGYKKFHLLKFRTMHVDSDNKGLLTIGADDERITPSGIFLRRYKLDELPQLFNVFKGEMTFVGPRPEVEKYVKLYTEEQKQVLNVKPGVTDLASIEYLAENELLGNSKDPENTYINEILPHKIEINLNYIRNKGLFSDTKVILKTLAKMTGYFKK